MDDTPLSPNTAPGTTTLTRDDSEDLGPTFFAPTGEDIIPWLTQTLNLSYAAQGDLFVFSESTAHLVGPERDLELFKMAIYLRHTDLTTSMMTQLTGLVENMDMIQQSIHKSTNFTSDQEAVVTSAALAAVWDPNRTDFSNAAMIESMLKIITANVKTNGFEELVGKNATVARKSALRAYMSKQASYAKSVLKVKVKTTKTSMTPMLRECQLRFMGTDAGLKGAHAVHLLILRHFAQDFVEPDEVSSTTENVNPGDGQSATKKRKTQPGTAAAGTDFLSQLTKWFEARQKEWGDDIQKSTGWAGYINLAIQDERDNFPDDSIPLLPTTSVRSNPVAPPPINNAPSTPTLATSRPTSFTTPSMSAIAARRPLFHPAAPAGFGHILSPVGPNSNSGGATFMYGDGRGNGNYSASQDGFDGRGRPGRSR